MAITRPRSEEKVTIDTYKIIARREREKRQRSAESLKDGTFRLFKDVDGKDRPIDIHPGSTPATISRPTSQNIDLPAPGPTLGGAITGNLGAGIVREGLHALDVASSTSGGFIGRGVVAGVDSVTGALSKIQNAIPSIPNNIPSELPGGIARGGARANRPAELLASIPVDPLSDAAHDFSDDFDRRYNEASFLERATGAPARDALNESEIHGLSKGLLKAAGDPANLVVPGAASVLRQLATRRAAALLRVTTKGMNSPTQELIIESLGRRMKLADDALPPVMFRRAKVREATAAMLDRGIRPGEGIPAVGLGGVDLAYTAAEKFGRFVGRQRVKRGALETIISVERAGRISKSKKALGFSRAAGDSPTVQIRKGLQPLEGKLPGGDVKPLARIKPGEVAGPLPEIQSLEEPFTIKVGKKDVGRAQELNLAAGRSADEGIDTSKSLAERARGLLPGTSVNRAIEDEGLDEIARIAGMSVSDYAGIYKQNIKSVADSIITFGNDVVPESIIKNVSRDLGIELPSKTDEALRLLSSAAAKSSQQIANDARLSGRVALDAVQYATPPAKALRVGETLQLPPITNDEMQELLQMPGHLNATSPGELSELDLGNVMKAFIDLSLGKLPNKSEIVLLEKVYGRDFAESIRAARTFGDKAWEEFIDVMNIPRALQTSFDYSAPLRQGIALAVGHPVAFTKAFGPMYKASFKERWARQIDDAMRADDDFDLIHGAGLFIAKFGDSVSASASQTAREEVFMSNMARHIPGIAQSERAYATFLNKLRFDVTKNTLREWRRTAWWDGLTGAEQAKNLSSLTTYINRATGRGSLGKLEGISPVLSAAFFSPRLQASRLQLPFSLIDSTPEVRKMVVKDLVAFVGTGVSILTLLKWSGWADVELNPRSSDFGRVRVGNQRFDFWGGFQPWARFGVQVWKAERKSTQTGNVSRIDPQWERAAAKSITSFGRAKLSPIAGFLVDARMGENILGDPVDRTTDSILQNAGSRLTPFWGQDIWDSFTKGGIAEAFAGGILGGHGISVQTYLTIDETSRNMWQDDAGKDLAFNDTQKWQQVGTLEHFRLSNPRTPGGIAGELEDINYGEHGRFPLEQALLDQFRAQTIPKGEFLNNYWNAQSRARDKRQLVFDQAGMEPEVPDASAPGLSPEERALAEWNSLFTDPEVVNEEGIFRQDILDEKMNALEERFRGEGTYDYIQMNTNLTLHPDGIYDALWAAGSISVVVRAFESENLRFKQANPGQSFPDFDRYDIDAAKEVAVYLDIGENLARNNTERRLYEQYRKTPPNERTFFIQKNSKIVRLLSAIDRMREEMRRKSRGLDDLIVTMKNGSPIHPKNVTESKGGVENYRIKDRVLRPFGQFAR